MTCTSPADSPSPPARSAPRGMLYRGLFEGEGLSLPLRPFIFTPHEVPLVIEVELARANPALAVFSAICHGDDADLDETSRRWHRRCERSATGSEYRSELLREIDAQGQALG